MQGVAVGGVLEFPWSWSTSRRWVPWAQHPQWVLPCSSRSRDWG